MPVVYDYVELHKKIIELIKQNHNSVEIASLLNIGQTTAKRHIARASQEGISNERLDASRRRCVKTDHKKIASYAANNPDLTASQIAEHFGVSHSLVNRATANIRIKTLRRLTTKEKEQILEEYNKGHGLYWIERYLGIPIYSAARFLHRSNVTLREADKKIGIGNIKRRATAKAEFSFNTKEEALNRTNFTCELCGLPLTRETCCFHHIKPVSQGGTADPENCMVLHSKCHREHSKKLHGFDISL